MKKWLSIAVASFLVLAIGLVVFFGNRFTKNVDNEPEENKDDMPTVVQPKEDNLQKTDEINFEEFPKEQGFIYSVKGVLVRQFSEASQTVDGLEILEKVFTTKDG